MQESKQLTLIVAELLAAHDDTMRLASELELTDWRWEQHLCYLGDVVTLGRAALVSASDCDMTERRPHPRPRRPRRGVRRCALNGHGEGPA